MEDSGAAFKKDIAASVVLGSLRFVAPSLAYLVLYRVVLQQGGVAVFGLWSLFAASSSYAALADVGLSQTLLREGSATVHEREGLYADYQSCVFAYATLAILLFAFWILYYIAGTPGLAPALRKVYPANRIVVAVAIMILASICKLIVKLDYAILGSFGTNSATFSIQTQGQFIFLGISLIASLAAVPIEGLSVGFLIGSIYEILRARQTLRRLYAWPTRRQQLVLLEAMRRLCRIVNRGRYLYVSSLGSLAREPLLRTFIVSAFGLPVAGFFDIGLRIAKTARESAAFGFSATFPYYARYDRAGDVAMLRGLMQWTLGLGLVAGTVPLVTLVALSHWIFSIWLGQVNYALEVSVVAMANWMWLTLLNIPFWYAALASKVDRRAAESIWIHCIAVILLFPANWILRLSYEATLLYWLSASACTQLYIAIFISRELGVKVFTFRLWLQAAIAGMMMAFSDFAALITNHASSSPVIFITILGIMASGFTLLTYVGAPSLLHTLIMLKPKLAMNQYYKSFEKFSRSASTDVIWKNYALPLGQAPEK